jgi:hypothetical protein
MREIKGFEGDFQDFLDLLRRDYSRRPAFIDELKSL